jgi:hypothetical protein
VLGFANVRDPSGCTTVVVRRTAHQSNLACGPQSQTFQCGVSAANAAGAASAAMENAMTARLSMAVQ